MDTHSEGPDQPDPMILARYLSGEVDREEAARVDRWMMAKPEHRALVDALRAVWARPPVPEFDRDDGLWLRVKNQIVAPGSRPALVPRSRVEARSFHLGRRWGVWAAVVAAGLVATAAIVARRQVNTPNVDHRPPAMREIATRRGERTELRLSDGSRVVLAPESRLRFPERLTTRPGQSWDLELEGEAYFEVVHDSTRPFRVHTPHGVAEDLGTEFVVTSYRETGRTRVVVASGIVALRQATALGARPDRARGAEPGAVLFRLGQGDLGTIDEQGQARQVHGVDVHSHLSWIEGKLVFDGTPLGEVVVALRRWYDLDVRLESPALADLKLTASFRDEPSSQVLRLIGMSLDLGVERNGDVVKLVSRSQPGSAR